MELYHFPSWPDNICNLRLCHIIKKQVGVCDIIHAQMNKFKDKEFDFAEYGRNLQKRRKRFAIGVIVVSIIVLAGMVIFWH